MVIYLVSLSLFSCLIAFILTPLVRHIAARNGFLDYPDERKLHKGAVPRVGGVAIAIASFISIVLSFILLRHSLNGVSRSLTGFLIGGLVITTLGTWDDLWKLSARRKMVGQIIAASILIPFGFVIRELNLPFLGIVKIGWKIGIPFSIFWVVGITNTMNFIDGMDGLAAGIAVLISSVFFAVSMFTGQHFIALICLIIAGSTLGFLRYNFHPASIFMGDSGAMFLGFSLAAISIKLLFQNTNITASSLVPVLVFGLPIVDTTWAILRRIIRHISPFRADGLHSHHRLVSLGLTQKQTVLILYAVGSLSAAGGLIIALTESEISAILISTIMLIIGITFITALGHAAPFEPTETQTDVF